MRIKQYWNHYWVLNLVPIATISSIPMILRIRILPIYNIDGNVTLWQAKWLDLQDNINLNTVNKDFFVEWQKHHAI